MHWHDRLLLAASAAAVLVLWVVGGSLLGALGAVIRFWLLFIAAAALLGRLPSARRMSPIAYFSSAAAIALCLEVGIELYLPTVAHLPGDDGPCYDRQGPHDC